MGKAVLRIQLCWIRASIQRKEIVSLGESEYQDSVEADCRVTLGQRQV